MSENNTPNNFYEDLDQKKRFSCCSCQTIAIVLAIILIAGGIGVWFLVKAMRQPLTPVQKVAPAANINNFWQTKFDQVWADWQAVASTGQQSAVVPVEITQEELTALLRQEADKSIDKKILEDPYVAVNPEAVKIYGTLLSPIKVAAVVDAVPKVTPAGELNFELKQVSAGKIKLPKSWLKKMEKQEGKLFGDLNEVLSADQGMRLQEIKLQDGKLILYLKAELPAKQA